MESEFHIGEYIAILKRRYIYIIIPFFVVLSISAAIAVLLPPVFQSTGTILIESPQISSELVRSAVNSLASERIEIIKQRVMTRGNLFRISEKFNVFRDETSILSTTEAVEFMRESAGVELINARTGGRRGLTTIAFKVSFEHRRPLVAVRVANELVTLFLDENVRTRTARASETTEFMSQEADKLERKLAEIEGNIADYEQEYSDSLPEHLNMRMDMLERAQNELKELDRDIKAFMEEVRFLDIQLAAIRAGYGQSRLNGAPGQAQRPRYEIQRLQSDLAELVTVYSPSHPDVARIQRRIEVVKAGIIEEREPKKLKMLQKSLETQLAGVKKRYTETHPDVLQLVSEISDIKEIIESLPEEPEAAPEIETIDPVLATIETKISVTDARIASLQEQKTVLKERIGDIESKIIQTPQVERGLKVLNRDYLNAQRSYSEIRAKQMSAELSESLEEDRKSERFVLIEPPSVPEEPIRPNRQKMLAIGFALSLAAGGAGIFLVELIDGSIRGTSSLAAVLNQQPIASIPYIVTTREARRRKRAKVMLILLMLMLIIGGLIAVHFFYMPLDIAYYKILSRF